MNVGAVLLVIIGLLLGFASGLTYAVYFSGINCESCEMRFDGMGEHGIDGLYSGEGYFCVWTKDKSLDEVFNTVTHELIHVMKREDRIHFNLTTEQEQNTSGGSLGGSQRGSLYHE